MVGVSRNSHFMRWVAARQYKCASKKDATHLLLCGGMLRIPDEDQALEMLAKDVLENRANYVVECRTPIFKMCMDFDFMTPREAEITTTEVKKYMAAVQGIMATMFPPGQVRMILCHAERKETSATVKKTTSRFENGALCSVETTTEECALVKTGFHAIWPDLLVNQELAVRARFVVHQHMEAAYPHFGKLISRDELIGQETCVLYSNWAQVLDLVIYTQNGLRMLGSSKASKCKAEHKDDDPCPDCSVNDYNTGFIDNGRPYGIATVIGPDGALIPAAATDLINNPLRALQLTSLRTDAEQPNATLTVPSWFSYEQEVRKALSGPTRTRQLVTAANGGVRPLGGDKDWGVEGERRQVQVGHDWLEFEVVSSSDPRAARFEKFLNEVMPHGRLPIVLRKILISTQVSRPYIFATGSCKWCVNVGREHNGQDVYFVYNGHRVEQRCWSVKEGADRKHGPCNGKPAQKFFRENARQLPSTLRDAMFPLSQAESVTTTLSLAPTPPLGEQSRALLAQVTAPGNRHPSCSPETIQRQTIFDVQRRNLLHSELGERFSYYDLHNGALPS